MDEPLTAAQIAELSEDDRQQFFDMLSPAELSAFQHHWPAWARPQQLPPAGLWSIWLVMAGRGFGKTRAGAEWVRQIVHEDERARFALIAANFAEARSVMVEGESGILSISPAAERPSWEPSLRRLRWANGAEATVYAATEPDGLRGPQHSHAWCDEIAKWHDGNGQALATWDNLKMGLRLGILPQITATTTPRPVALVRRLVTDDGVVITRGGTDDNHLNLPDIFLTAMAADYGGTRLGRQEIDGELIEELEGALWTRAMIEECRVSAGEIDLAAMVRIVIGVDPPTSSTGDACGIIVSGLGGDGQAYILADCSTEKASPEKWAQAVALAARSWGADRVIAEANQGGEMVSTVLRAATVNLPVRLVHAARGKVARAEPIAALYEHGRVHHRGTFAALEDELCGLLIGGSYQGPGRSPDRADALVWALSELMLKEKREPRVR